MSAKMVPSMAQSVVSGAALSFGHEMFTSSASSLVNGAIGEKSPNGGRTGGLLGTSKTIVETLRNTQTAAFRGVADTLDAAKEGGIGGAVEHVASKIPVVNDIVSASKTGNMANYIEARVAFGADSDRAKRYLNNDTPEMKPVPKTDDNPNSAESIYKRLNNEKELF
ncbi:MAG: hypothetical protein IJ859_11465 [Synergistaceae bacterium]|nr:hypothetical protein [Synergistaceae bacterium]